MAYVETASAPGADPAGPDELAVPSIAGRQVDRAFLTKVVTQLADRDLACELL